MVSLRESAWGTGMRGVLMKHVIFFRLRDPSNRRNLLDLPRYYAGSN